MKFIISAIGKLNKKKPEQALIDDYLKKTKWPVSICESEEKKSLTGDLLKEAEEKLLWKNVPDNAKVIVLDERGDELSSRELARKIASWRDTGIQTIAFLIGGADGHTQNTRDKADVVLSMGRLTLPHFLARVVLIEQIYRAKTIIEGHPYHRD